MKRILIAGIGNIFLGDDAFGCEVVRELSRHALPEGVRAIDFGIRGYDLACALTDGYDAAILVDAAPRGDPPGTTCLLELDLERLGPLGSAALDAHSLEPVRLLKLAQTLGHVCEKLYLVGCEPAVLECEDGEIALSEPVRRAVPQALRMLNTLLANLLDSKTKGDACLARA